MTELLGLIAGDGDFPLEIARGAHRQGRRVHAVGFHGLTRGELDTVADELTWLHLGEVDALLGHLRSAGVGDVVVAGKVDKTHLGRLAGQLRLDDHGRALLAQLPDHQDASILSLLVRVLEDQGMALRSQVECVPELVVRKGVQGRVSPDEAAWRDIRQGLDVALRLAGDEIGQCVVVKDGVTVAVEAMEGTDAVIARAASLAGQGASVVKVAGPRHDPRFDVPVIGSETARRVVDAGARALVVEAGATVVLHHEDVVRRLDDAGIAFVGVSRESATPPSGVDA